MELKCLYIWLVGQIFQCFAHSVPPSWPVATSAPPHVEMDCSCALKRSSWRSTISIRPLCPHLGFWQADPWTSQKGAFLMFMVEILWFTFHASLKILNKASFNLHTPRNTEVLHRPPSSLSLNHLYLKEANRNKHLSPTTPTIAEKFWFGHSCIYFKRNSVQRHAEQSNANQQFDWSTLGGTIKIPNQTLTRKTRIQGFNFKISSQTKWQLNKFLINYFSTCSFVLICILS